VHIRVITAQALREVARARQRTILVALAVMLGVSGAITAESYAAAGQARLVAQLGRLGITIITVTPKQSRNAGLRARTGAPVKTLDEACVACRGEEVVVTFAARSFLHRQVRSMTGSLAEVGAGRWTPADLKTALEAKDRTACGQVAPAEGLYLAGVEY